MLNVLWVILPILGETAAAEIVAALARDMLEISGSSPVGLQRVNDDPE